MEEEYRIVIAVERWYRPSYADEEDELLPDAGFVSSYLHVSRFDDITTAENTAYKLSQRIPG